MYHGMLDALELRLRRRTQHDRRAAQPGQEVHAHGEQRRLIVRDRLDLVDQDDATAQGMKLPHGLRLARKHHVEKLHGRRYDDRRVPSLGKGHMLLPAPALQVRHIGVVLQYGRGVLDTVPDGLRVLVDDGQPRRREHHPVHAPLGGMRRREPEPGEGLTAARIDVQDEQARVHLRRCPARRRNRPPGLVDPCLVGKLGYVGVNDLRLLRPVCLVLLDRPYAGIRRPASALRRVLPVAVDDAERI